MRGEERRTRGTRKLQEQGSREAGEQLPTTNYQLPIPNSQFPFFTNN
ncbi:hypothetical protein [Chroococcidiopsis sp. CCALA 051]|nr:hypothetical protein [Chroococcidiopsis sp. CCALA 051]